MSEILENTAPKKRMLSGIQPSGDLHLGNYLGAIRNWGARSDLYECFYFMADLHTITVRQTPADLRRRTLEQLAAVWIPRRTPCSFSPMFISMLNLAGF